MKRLRAAIGVPIGHRRANLTAHSQPAAYRNHVCQRDCRLCSLAASVAGYSRVCGLQPWLLATAAFAGYSRGCWLQPRLRATAVVAGYSRGTKRI